MGRSKCLVPVTFGRLQLQLKLDERVERQASGLAKLRRREKKQNEIASLNIVTRGDNSSHK